MQLWLMQAPVKDDALGGIKGSALDGLGAVPNARQHHVRLDPRSTLYLILGRLT
jgi:hypothetical protein